MQNSQLSSLQEENCTENSALRGMNQMKPQHKSTNKSSPTGSRIFLQDHNSKHRKKEQCKTGKTQTNREITTKDVDNIQKPLFSQRTNNIQIVVQAPKKPTNYTLTFIECKSDPLHIVHYVIYRSYYPPILFYYPPILFNMWYIHPSFQQTNRKVER